MTHPDQDLDFLSRAMGIEADLVAWRRTIHQNPEIGFDLPKTLAFVESHLRAFGYQPERVGKAGVVVTVGQGEPTILLRGDMDALPMEEKSGLPFSADNGFCHSCGHDIHTTVLLGAAKILKEREADLPGTVKLMFQPCEEKLAGMQDMIDHGLLENPAPQAALALHVIGEKTGTVGIRPGYAGASCDSFAITIHGVGCHGAAPDRGVDPINVAAHLILALQTLNSREVAPDRMLVLTICSVKGGDASNIIPDHCELLGTIRTDDDQVRAFARKRLVEICEQVAGTFRAKAEVDIWGSVPPMVNDPALSRELSSYVDELFGAGTAWEVPAMTGSEDFSLLCDRIPSVLAWFGTGTEEEGFPHGNHHPAVLFNEAALPKMCATYAHCAYRWLTNRR